ncbi:MAG: SMI1/KNR4 family protein [Candidatus Azobacteroides sp.]|nr:SMI1/KNR4 family protein [Candidatus Azobacteroides sp.]
MEAWKQLEKEFGFQYPDIYHRLYSAGMLTSVKAEDIVPVEEFEIGTNATLGARLKKQAGEIPFLNAIEGMRVLTAEKVRYRLTESYIGENADPRHKLIPFAVDPAGAWYAFSFDLQQNDDVPVLFIDDCDYAYVWTKNLADFIFYIMLEAVAYIPDGTDLEGRRRELQKMLVTHAPYMNPVHVEKMREILKREFSSSLHQPSEVHSYTEYHLISKEEETKLGKEYLDFELRNTGFDWMKESL